VSAAVTNISCYRFAPLTGLKPLRAELLESCKAWGLKGTILLAPEGINLFVAGAAESIDRLLARLRAVPGLETLTPKVSLSETQPVVMFCTSGISAIRSSATPPTAPTRRTPRRLIPQPNRCASMPGNWASATRSREPG